MDRYDLLVNARGSVCLRQPLLCIGVYKGYFQVNLHSSLAQEDFGHERLSVIPEFCDLKRGCVAFPSLGCLVPSLSVYMLSSIGMMKHRDGR